MGAGVTLAKVTASAIGCASPTAGPAKSSTPPAAAPPAANDGALDALAVELASCRRVGDDCLAHCLRQFAAGDTMMAECAQRTSAMLAICDAMARVVALRSELARSLAPTCKLACSECAAACKPHVGHAAECKACFEACAAAQLALANAFA
ncbi:MAG: four-helix bundle copper-binding protein [Deltaproteobacteria bacterium]|nr:four-helix bundle copper-binding protein [Nannocystaceae bacterium]